MAPLLSLLVTSSILQLLYRALLPKILVNQNYPVVMISMHSAVGGLGLGSLELEQMVEAINLFVSLFNSDTSSSKLLIDSLELLQVDVGLDCLVLEQDFNKYRYLVSPC